MPFRQAEDVHGWLSALVSHLQESSELAEAALEYLSSGDTQKAVNIAREMRLPVTQSSNALLGFLAEMHHQGVDANDSEVRPSDSSQGSAPPA